MRVLLTLYGKMAQEWNNKTEYSFNMKNAKLITPTSANIQFAP